MKRIAWLLALVGVLGTAACTTSDAGTTSGTTGVAAAQGTTATTSSATPPAQYEPDPRVVLGSYPDEVCEPKVDRQVVDTLNVLGTAHDPHVSERLKAILKADQDDRRPMGPPPNGGAMPSGEPGTSLPLPDEPGGVPLGVTVVPPPSEEEREQMGEDPFGELGAADRERREEVMDYVRAGKITTAEDLAIAATIFHHGACIDHFALAHLLAAKALERGGPEAQAIYRLSLERYLGARDVRERG